MCGLGGILTHRGRPPQHDELRRMTYSLQHRGPDDAGIYRDERCGLAHTRLAIIDLEGGKQPLSDVDEESHLAFNGEIFNYRELRDELIALGYRFKTRSDTEVVIQALRAWGEDALRRFNGQFAIALWTPRTQTLLLARDRLGVRPLHICAHADRVYFASEAKAIFAADPTIPRELDPVGLAETFTFWTVLAPRTVFRGIEELRPGHVRVYRPDGITDRCYWDLSFPRYGEERGGSIAESADALRAALSRATARRLECADVPVACYLSGGLDSSIIAALGRQIHGAGLRTFSLRFTDADLDESPFQRMMARELETDHIEVEVSRADVADAFPTAIRHIERPILRTAPAPMLLLARRVREAGIKVVLTGEGADEMLAGYDLFREARVRRFWAREPSSSLRPRLLERLYPYLTRSPASARAMAREFFGRDLELHDSPTFAHGPRWRAAAALQRLLSPDVRRAAANAGDPVDRMLAALPAGFSSWDPLARDQYLEVRTLLSGYLLSSQGDRVAMANSVEGRYPFLDVDVVELACSLPPDHKLRVLDEKHVLKRAAAGLVPPSIIRRPKQPYRAPDAVAFCDEPLRGWVSEVLDERALRNTGLFDAAAVARLWDKCRRRGEGALSNTDNMALTGVLSTQLLARDLPI
ncbi:MAG: asparagine synthase (glutamine-hydrolyzing) [Kofleriaceae bacterium]|nr:asparagine synthase (glutamine-hydrolyzing) [Kofleriaceae bacterium]